MAIAIFDPTYKRSGKGELSKRLDTLDGKVIGVIWNGRRPGPGESFLLGTVEELKKHYDIKDVLFKAKPFVGNVAPDEIFTYMESRAHMIITGVGD
jgi:hypothetical protein